jgi:outer membrane protein OmpA-like peptidoglycan-associated protein
LIIEQKIIDFQTTTDNFFSVYIVFILPFNMMNLLNFPKMFVPALICLCTTAMWSQKTKYDVDRCKAVNMNKPVRNIQSGGDQFKWVASGQEIFQVRACNLGTQTPLQPGEQSVLSFFGGNTDKRWIADVMLSQARNATDITSAWYDAKNDWLWIGTKFSGLLQFKTNPALTFIEQYTTTNSKLKSNEITCIYQDASGKYWIGNKEGLMIGAPKKWKSELDGYGVQRIRAIGNGFYVLADSEFWDVQGEKFKSININDKAFEGEAVDFDFDPAGNLWILSRMLTRYDLMTDEFDTFSGPEYYTSEYGLCIEGDADGAVWVGTEDKGLFHIEKSASFTVNCLVETELSCNGNGKDASLIVKIDGGKAPYTYTWSQSTMTGDNPKNLVAGNYTVTVTDLTGNTKSAKVSIGDNKPKLTTRQKQPESGPGLADGSAEVIVEGGSKPYQFKWSNGETTAITKKMIEGTYTVTVTESKGCSATITAIITQKRDAFSAAITEMAPIKCNGGETTLKVSASGGKPPYQYAWNVPALKGDQPGAVVAGVYNLTLTDAAGGTFTTSITVKQPEPLSATTLLQSAAGTGKSDGKALVQPVGGTGKYNFAWDNAENTAAAIKLNPGEHRVTVSDANGCTATATVKVTENILPLAVQLTENSKIKCAGEKAAIAATVTGGKTPFTYIWADNPANSANLDVLAGAYQLTVKDAAGTTATATLTVKQPDPITATATAVSAASTGKADGKASVQGKGGTGKYTYLWDNAETGVSTAKLNNGKHSVTLTDANGCTATATVEITENILPLVVSMEEIGKIKCSGQPTTVKLSVSGGKEPYQYKWSDAKISDLPTSLLAGVYTVTVTDAPGTTSTATINIRQPQQIAVNATALAPASTGNSDGKASVQALGGAGKFTYAWDNSETTATAAKLAPAQHAVTVTDANGCTATATVQITENVLALAATITETGQIKCAGEKSGLKVTVSGGKPPFKYQWSAKEWFSDEVVNVHAGAYEVTVSDAKGNTQVLSATVKGPDPLLVSIVRSGGATTDRTKDGWATVDIKGGKTPYNIAWDNAETIASASKLTLGNHGVTVTDAAGCTNTAAIEIGKRMLPELSAANLQSGQAIRVEQLKFAADSSSLSPECYPVLNEVYNFLQENGTIVIEVGGHTNNAPSDAFADKLSTARAKAAADYLVAKGVDSKRVLYKGYGKRKPIASNTTKEGRAQNQRVEIKILEIKKQ